MDEQLFQAKMREFEREIARTRLASAAKPQPHGRPAVTRPRPQTAPGFPLRLLRVLRPAS